MKSTREKLWIEYAEQNIRMNKPADALLQEGSCD